MWKPLSVYVVGAAASTHGFVAQLPREVRGNRAYLVLGTFQSLLWPLAVYGKLEDSVFGRATDEDVRLWRETPTTMLSGYVERRKISEDHAKVSVVFTRWKNGS